MDIITDSAHALGISSQEICKFYNENWNRKIALGIPDFLNGNFCNVLKQKMSIIASLLMTKKKKKFAV